MTTTTTTTHPPRITFPVDDVTPAPEPRQVCKILESLRGLIEDDRPVESCSDYHSDVLMAGTGYHGLLAAVAIAHAEHRPLVLSPDMLWITISQGIAQHMTLHAERLRSRFVAHAGRKKLTVVRSDLVRGSPENLWHEIFASWSSLIRDHVSEETHAALVCDFSTTGAVERAASEIVLMDIFQKYFHYELVCVCGIPQITLEGAPADWQNLRAKIEILSRFDMASWLEHLRPIFDEFARAAAGTPDRPFWKNFCKQEKAYGGNIINGHVAKLFPYLRRYCRGPTDLPNPIFTTGEGFSTFNAPSGLAKAPFTWIDSDGERAMEALGGFLGVEQDPATLALRAKIGWAVRECAGLDRLIARVQRDHHAHPGATGLMDTPEPGQWTARWRPLGVEPDMGHFYHATNGAELFGEGSKARFRLLPVESFEKNLANKEMLALGREALRFAELADGGSLWTHPEGIEYVHIGLFGRQKRVLIAASFEAFLRKALDSGGAYWW